MLWLCTVVLLVGLASGVKLPTTQRPTVRPRPPYAAPFKPTPKPGTTQPGYLPGTTQPDYGTQTGYLPVTPDYGTTQPGYLPVTPDYGTTQTGYLPVTPDYGTTQPGYLPTGPGTPTGYLPPAYPVTRTRTITVTVCPTQDIFVTSTIDVYRQQYVTVVLCTKNLDTETQTRQIAIPVNDNLIVRTTTLQLQPRTIVVTDVSTNFDLQTAAIGVVATLTHRSRNFVTLSITNTQTETLTLTTLVVSTHVNTRLVTETTTQTVTNTIVVDIQPVLAGGYQQSGIRDGEAIGFGGEAGRSPDLVASGFRSGGLSGGGRRPGYSPPRRPSYSQPPRRPIYSPLQ